MAQTLHHGEGFRGGQVIFNSHMERDLEVFKAEADVIVANRSTSDLADVAGKVFTCDLFGAD